MKFFITIFSGILFFCTACSKQTENVYIPPVNIPVDTIPVSPYKKMLSLGDSYTIGTSVAAVERFPVQTAALLQAQGVLINSPEIIATNGWTTGNLLAALNASPPARNFDAVTLLIGVNNQYQRKPLEEYKTQFTELLNRAILCAANRPERVFVLSIPDYSVTPFAAGGDTATISNEIDAFNAANKEISLAKNVRYLDITGISREARYDQSLTATDGLHPSGKQYGRWAALLAPLISSVL